MAKSSARSGFTLVEMLVVITIIATLMGLVLPAVQQARARAGITECSNNMHQLATGLTSYEMTNGAFPYYSNPIPLRQSPSSILTKSNLSVPTIKYPKIGSWVIPILPMIEKNDFYSRWTNDNLTAAQVLVDTNDSRQGIFYDKALVCPSAAPPDTDRPWLSYVVNSGCGNPPGTSSNVPTPAEKNRRDDGVFHDAMNGGPTVNTGYITSLDGTSYTALFTENVNAGSWSPPFDFDHSNSNPMDKNRTLSTRLRTMTTVVWLDKDGIYPKLDECRINSKRDTAGTPIGNIDPQSIPLADDSMTQWTFARPSSRHPGGVNVAMCDGSVKWVREGIDYDTYCQLMTPNGKVASCKNCTATDQTSRPGPVRGDDL